MNEPLRKFEPVEPTVSLDRPVMDHLGAALRSALKSEDAAGHLGHRGLPPELEQLLVALDEQVRARHTGVEAVRTALGLTDPERGGEAA